MTKTLIACLLTTLSIYSFSIKCDQIVTQKNSILFIRYTPIRVQHWSIQELTHPKKLSKNWKPITITNQKHFISDIVKGQNNNYLLLDNAQNIIWQLDSSFNTVSFFPLPLPNKYFG